MSDFYLIATPIGNLSDISRRAVEVLKSVDLVLAEDTRRTAILTKNYEIDVPLMSLHGHNERYRISAVLEMLDKGKMSHLYLMLAPQLSRTQESTLWIQ